MTPERLDFVIEACWRRHRREDGTEGSYRAVADYLGVTPITLRRWLRGERPIPRAVEVVMEVFHGWPELRAEEVEEAIARGRADATSTRRESVK